MSGSPTGALGKILALSLLWTVLAADVHGETFTPKAALDIKSVADPTFSPDGKWIVYQVSERDLDEDKSHSSLWIVPVDGSQEPRRLTLAGSSASGARFSPDGGRLAFLSKREGDDSRQIYVLPLSGGEAWRLTEFPGGVGEHAWSPDGTMISFIAEVYPECETIDCTADKDDERKAKAEKGPEPRRHTTLLYRHWNRYESEKVKHLFTVPSAGGEPRDLTPGLEKDCLQWPMAVSHAGHDYEWSPDGNSIVLATNLNDRHETDYDVDLYLLPSSGGDLRCLTDDNPAADGSPRFSPDGRYLAYRASERPGYEADRYRLMIKDLETGETGELAPDLDRHISDLWWGGKGKKIFFSVNDRGNVQVYSVSPEGGEPRLATPLPGTYSSVSSSPDGKWLLYRKSTHDAPYEIFVAEAGKDRERQITFVNGDFAEKFDLATVEEFWFEGSGSDRVQGWILKPHDYDASREYPVILGVHGGPQGMYGNRFHTTYQILAAQGYVVVFTNPRGSMGYGQEFVDGINADWGGKVMEDLDLGLDAALTRISADRDRIGATGWSFGGYAMNWLLGHSDRYAAVLSGAGLANLWSFYGSTEELFFPEWEFGGTPWDRKEMYDRLSPIRYAENFETPTLFVHGDQDFRVPVTEGEQMFTAMQRRGIPSEFLRFHDEGHWIQRPTNLLTLYESYVEWFDRWLKEEVLDTP